MESAAETKIAHAVYYFCSSLFEVIVFRFSSLHLRGNPAEPACLSHPQSLMTAAEDEKKKRLPKSALKRSLIPFLPFFSANRFSLPSIFPLPSLSPPAHQSHCGGVSDRPTLFCFLSPLSLHFLRWRQQQLADGFWEEKREGKRKRQWGTVESVEEGKKEAKKCGNEGK